MVKGYLLGQITISDKSQYKKYDAKIGDVIKEFGGKYLVKGGLRIDGVIEVDNRLTV